VGAGPAAVVSPAHAGVPRVPLLELELPAELQLELELLELLPAVPPAPPVPDDDEAPPVPDDDEDAPDEEAVPDDDELDDEDAPSVPDDDEDALDEDEAPDEEASDDEDAPPIPDDEDAPPIPDDDEDAPPIPDDDDATLDDVVCPPLPPHVTRPASMPGRSTTNGQDLFPPTMKRFMVNPPPACWPTYSLAVRSRPLSDQNTYTA